MESKNFQHTSRNAQFENLVYSGNLTIKNDYNVYTLQNYNGQSLIDYVLVNYKFKCKLYSVIVQDFHLIVHKNISIEIYDINIINNDSILTLDADIFISNLNADLKLNFETSLKLASKYY